MKGMGGIALGAIPRSQSKTICFTYSILKQKNKKKDHLIKLQCNILKFARVLH